jgi:hypothetical protein
MKCKSCQYTTRCADKQNNDQPVRTQTSPVVLLLRTQRCHRLIAVPIWCRIEFTNAAATGL